MTKKERIIVPIVCVALLGVFTFTDLAFSMALFSKNLFGRFFEVVGELPFAFFSVFAFALLFKFRTRISKSAGIVTGIVFGLLAALFSVMGGFMTWNYLHENIENAPQFIAVIFAAALLAGAYLLARRVPKEKSREAITFAIIVIIYFVAVIVIMNLLKTIWSRMRIREMTDPITQFTRWYIITDHAGFDNAMASFPSGHAMNAAGTILLCLLPSFLQGLSGKVTLMKIIAYVWMVLIGISRVIMGAHFASDVVVGIMLSLILFEVIRVIICNARKTKLPYGEQLC